MGLKLEKGVYALHENGLPESNSPQEELLQNAALRLSIPKGSFPYGRQLGSMLHSFDRTGEHAEEQAVSLANESLMDMPGVTAEQARFTADGRIEFTISTPLGRGKVFYGDV